MTTMNLTQLYDSHIHTALCLHADGEPVDYAAVAAERGLKGLIITDHNPIDGDAWEPGIRMRPEEFSLYLEQIEQAREKWKGLVDVRLGLESDWFPGHEAHLARLHQRAEFDFIWGSIHCNVHAYAKTFYRGDVLEYQKLYYDHLARAAETGLFDAMTHPDVPKFMFPDDWNVEVLLDDIRRSLDRIAATGLALELNTSGLHKPYPEMNPGREILELMLERNIPVIIGSDAHTPSRVGADFDLAVALLDEIGFRHVSYFIGRKRQDVPISAIWDRDISP
ncbi:MAG: histidinol-phosphatase [Kiritimatiellales bacterium]|nr:histidinol-phosphatase [Kiritimatiellales bacterium]